MGCCISYSQISDKDLMSAIPERTAKHSNRRKQENHLQTRRLNGEEMGNRVKDQERINKEKTSNTTSNRSILSEELKISKVTNEIQSKREKMGSKIEEFEQPTHPFPSGWGNKKYCCSFESYDFKNRVPSSQWPSTNSASDPVQTVNSSDMDEQAKPNINIVPIAPPPPVLPI